MRKPSPALVVACLALAVSLGGVGYAAVKLPKNSVGQAQLRANAVVSSKVRNRSLRAVDFAAGQLPRGRVGPTGPKGSDAQFQVALDAHKVSGDHDGRYTRSNGLTLISVPSNGWVVQGFGTAAITHFADSTRFTAGPAPQVFVGATPTIPLAQYGKRLRILGAEVCYDASGGSVVLEHMGLSVLRESTSSSGTEVATVTDMTHRTDAACRLYMLPAPFTLTEEDSLVVGAGLNYSASANFFIGRTTIVLEPTTTAAVAPG